MSVAAQTFKVQYVLTSATQALAVPFYFLSSSHLRVIRTRSNVKTVLASGFTVAGVGAPAGGTVTLLGTETAIGDRITIMRVLPLTQTISYAENDKFRAASHERGLDEALMRTQQLQEVANRSLQFGEDEVDPAVTLTLASRRGKTLGFDVNGAVQLSNPVQAVTQAGEVLSFSSFTAARALSSVGLVDGEPVSITGYASAGDGGGGTPWTFTDVDPGIADNNGTVLELDDGAGWLIRNFSGPVNVRWFGAKGDNVADDTDAIQAAIDTAGAGDGMTSYGGVGVFIPAGVYRVTNLTLLRGVKVIGLGPKVTVMRKTSTTGYAFEFDSTGITPGTVQDQVTIEGLSIWQVGTPTNGGGIRVDGVTSDARATLLDVHVQNCYRGVLTRNTIQSTLRNVNCFYSVKKGFEFTGSSYAMTAINCFASSGGDDGWELNDGNYCTLVGCAADNNAEAGYRLKNCHFMKMVGCGNEGNKYGAYLYICDGVEIDTFYTLVKSNTLNAIVLDASQRNTLRNIGSSHVNSAYGTYMVSAINSSVFNVLETGYQSNKWPGASNNGVVDDIGAFMEVTHFLEGAQPVVKNIRWPVVNLTAGQTNLRGITFNGGIIPPIDMQTALANEKRIIAIYSSGDVFSGIGMNSADISPRIAGNTDGTGLAADIGYYSEDGSYTWNSRFRFSGQGVLKLRNDCEFLDGDGSPEGVVAAPPGSLFLNKQGGASTEAYLKETGTGNTGWKAITTA